MKTAEQISSEILDKYSLTIDMSIPIEDAVKQAREDLLKDMHDSACDNESLFLIQEFKEKI